MGDRRGRPPRRFSPSPSKLLGVEKQNTRKRISPQFCSQEVEESETLRPTGRRLSRKRGYDDTLEIDVVGSSSADQILGKPIVNLESRKRKRNQRGHGFFGPETSFGHENDYAPSISPESPQSYPCTSDTPQLEHINSNVEIDPVADETLETDEPPLLALLEQKPSKQEKHGKNLGDPTENAPSLINCNDLEEDRFYALRFLFLSMQPDVTEFGDKYLTVQRECVVEFLHKDVILDFIANCTRKTQEMGWVNRAPPLLPPESEGAFTFCFLIDGSRVQPQKTRLDALSPWSRNKEDFDIDEGIPLPTLRCKQRNMPVVMEAGRCRIGQGSQHRSSAYSLHEYTAVHPCCSRLKKRIYYVTRDDVPFGNLMVIYEFVTDGSFPILTKKMQHVLDMYRKGNYRALLTILPGQACRFDDEGKLARPVISERTAQIDEKNIIAEIVEIEDVLDGSESFFTTLPIPGEENDEILEVVHDLPFTDSGEVFDLESIHLNEKSFSRNGNRAEKDWKNHPFVEDEIITMDDGSRCIRAHTVVWAKEKEALLGFLINDPKKIPSEWISTTKPTLPPLVTACTAFVFFVNVDDVDFTDLTSDGLMPWTTNGFHSKTRKIGMTSLPNGQWKLDFAKSWRRSDTFLVEYSAILGRCPRLRKRIIYVRSAGHPVGRCIFSYEYIEEGLKPTINTEFLEKKNRQDTMRIERQKQNSNRQSLFIKGYEEVDELTDDEGFLREEIIEDYTELDEITIDAAGTSNFDVDNLANEISLNTTQASSFYLEDEAIDSYDVAGCSEASAYGSEVPLTSHELFLGLRFNQFNDVCVRIKDADAVIKKTNLLSWISNDTSYLIENNLIQRTRPECPPLVSSEGVFIFFVDSAVVDKKLLYRDALSPWSGTLKGESSASSSSNTKTQKWGLERALNGELICVGIRQAFDPKIQYLLFENYVVHFRFPRLQRRVYYVLDLVNNQMIGNVVIAYIYSSPGPPPTVSRSKFQEIEIESFSQKVTPGKAYTEMIDVYEKFPVLGDSICFRVRDTRLVYDRRSLLDLAFNDASIVSQMGLLNEYFPRLPPLTTEVDCFVCFVDAKACSILDQRHLTIDALSPWSEGQRGDEVFIRPKIKRYLLFRNKDKNTTKLELLPASLTPGTRRNAEETPCEYSLVVYTATLPRCQRLKKRIYYVMCGRCIVGNVIIFYTYDSPGSLPTEVSHGNSKLIQPSYNSPALKRDNEKHSDLSKDRQVKPFDFRNFRIDVCRFLKAIRRDEVNLDVNWPLERKGIARKMNESTKTEETTQGSSQNTTTQLIPGRTVANEVQKKIDAILDFTAYQFDSRSETEVLDALWQVLLMRNEARLLHNIKEEYGVEFVQNEGGSDLPINEGTTTQIHHSIQDQKKTGK